MSDDVGLRAVRLHRLFPNASGRASLTASQNIAHVPLEAACTAWTSWQRSCDCDDHSSMEGRDRVWDVTLGPDRRRRGVGNRWEWQGFCTSWRDEVLRGGSSSVRGS